MILSVVVGYSSYRTKNKCFLARVTFNLLEPKAFVNGDWTNTQAIMINDGLWPSFRTLEISKLIQDFFFISKAINLLS